MDYRLPVVDTPSVKNRFTLPKLYLAYFLTYLLAYLLTNAWLLCFVLRGRAYVKRVSMHV